MQIPNIPTDNLYKFMAITGLLAILISIGSYIYSKTNIERDILEVNHNTDILKFDNENLENDMINFQRIMDKDFFSKLDSNVLLRLNTVDTSIKPSTIFYDYYLKSTNIKDTNLKVLVSVWQELLKRGIDIKKNCINLEYNLKQIEFKQNLLKMHYVASSVGFFAGVYLSVFGLMLWYNKHQKYLVERS